MVECLGENARECIDLIGGQGLSVDIFTECLNEFLQFSA